MTATISETGGDPGTHFGLRTTQACACQPPSAKSTSPVM